MIYEAVTEVYNRLGALALLIIFSPVYLIVSLVILVSMGRPVLFRQARPGLHGELFHVYKFRTMKNSTDADGNLLPDEERLTDAGKIIRKLSLDELPQLINVLKGDMRVVGPRPLLPEYLPLYSDEQMRRHDVKPGITGWAQVNGRNAISWAEKFRYDVEYVENRSVFFDMKIIFLTIYKVLKREGISGKGVVTAEKFNGKN